MTSTRLNLSGLAGLMVFCLLFPAAVQAQGFSLPRAEIQVSRDCEQCPEMVTLPSGLRMSKHHVTRAQFAAFAQETGFRRNGWGCAWNYPGAIEQADDHPAVCIAYADAIAYLEWLSARTGKTYRLPTVEEYRQAASSGAPTNYWWGEDIGENRANCIACGSPYDGKGTSPVGSFAANPYGIADALGNAWQWTSDCQDSGCQRHALIGGSWSSPPADLRLSKVIWNDPNVPFYTYGLRVVTESEP
ncbi:formylglycine-generating enzyme family protein [Devosia nitrariae]|uniref:Sulfatase-modifying factor enzyme-like domain-containing protein n=1 Tax=Devosia nitrariae TaxID=2071872 RepID=A0ABQ5WD25_9HYPH|nr:SUMF1/EgtB/PvdO family nonheme iron enzyme [Devosia nitrariae]GLQ57999.1 hypothetical protein GCM10010862_52580 [Devosia nitrariae]